MASLGGQVVGSIVKLTVDDTATDFIVVQQGLPSSVYDSSCDGTWLLMKDIYKDITWFQGSSPKNDYENSYMHSYLNGTLLKKFDSVIRELIKQVKIPYTKGESMSGSVGQLQTGANGLSTKLFLLSRVEIGASTGANKEGDKLSYFLDGDASKRIAYLNGTAKVWWTRSPMVSYTSATHVYRVSASGSVGSNSASGTFGCRPALILPSTMGVESDGTVVMASGGINGSVNIGGVERELTGDGYINIGGVLHELSDSKVNIGGTLKSTKG